MIIDKIIDFIETCPYLDEFAQVCADYLDEDACTSYSVEVSPSEVVVKEYVNGSKEKQVEFALCSREVQGAFQELNIENIQFYEKFSMWIEEKNRKRILPLLEEPLQSLRIEVTSPGHVLQTEVDKGLYIIQMRLVYFQNVN